MPRLRIINRVFFVVGLAGLVFLVFATGPDVLFDGLRRVGWAFPLVVLLHVGAIASDSMMLWACAGRCARWRFVFRASLAGHGINEATPLAKLGEITKYTLLIPAIAGEHSRDRAAAALIVQNITMFVAGCLTIAIGSLVTVFAFDLPRYVSQTLVALSVAFAVVALVALAVFRFGIGSWPFRPLGKVGVPLDRVEEWRGHWASVEARWKSVTTSRRLMAINWCAAALSRSLEVMQAVVILWALGSEQVVCAAVMSVASFQLILWATAFIPMQVGSHEAGAFALFASVGLSPSTGLLLELVRKLRRVVFVLLGVGILGASAFREDRKGPE